MEMIVPGIALIVLLILSGFFAGTETALFSLSKVEKRRAEKEHAWLSKWLVDHLEHPRRTLITILIGNLVVNILSASIVTLIAMRYFSPAGVSMALAVYTVILILIGEILPKVVAVRINESFSLLSSIPLKFFSVIIWPVIILTQKISNALLSLLTSAKKGPTDKISENDLIAMVKISEEDGVLDRDERAMIQNLLELGEKCANDIMTPRIDLKALDVEDPRSEHLELMQRFHFSHFPVYRETIDNILGVIPAQEYILNEKERMESFLVQPLFIPETKRIDDLLADFKKKNKQFAICLDEYGGTAGVVTLEDVLEEVFGEVYDEYAKVENPIRPFGHHEYLVDAQISLVDFNEYFSVELESEEANTLGGVILEKLGDIPAKGKILNLDECEIQIHEVFRRRRIRRVIVRVKS